MLAVFFLQYDPPVSDIKGHRFHPFGIVVGRGAAQRGAALGQGLRSFARRTANPRRSRWTFQTVPARLHVLPRARLRSLALQASLLPETQGRGPAINKFNSYAHDRLSTFAAYRLFATPVGVTDRCKTRRCTAIDEFGVVAARLRERAFVNACDRPNSVTPPQRPNGLVWRCGGALS